MSGVDEGYLGTSEQLGQQLVTVGSREITLEKIDIGKFREFVKDQTFSVPNLRSDLPAHSSCSSNERGGLPPSCSESMLSEHTS